MADMCRQDHASLLACHASRSSAWLSLTDIKQLRAIYLQTKQLADNQHGARRPAQGSHDMLFILLAPQLGVLVDHVDIELQQ